MQAHVFGLTIYWAFAGGLMGLGVITVFSIGIPLVLLGIFFMSYGLAKLERRGLWAALVAFGTVPGGLLLYDYIAFSDRSMNEFTLVLPFAAIALVGVIWALYEGFQKALR